MNIFILQAPRLCGGTARVLDDSGNVLEPSPSLSITNSNHTHSTVVLRLSDIAHSMGFKLKIELMNRVGGSHFEIRLPGNTKLNLQLVDLLNLPLQERSALKLPLQEWALKKAFPHLSVLDRDIVAAIAQSFSQQRAHYCQQERAHQARQEPYSRLTACIAGSVFTAQ